jgi:hypothetical protein
MTVLATTPQVDVGSPPKEPICRSAKDETKPCRFADACHESRQRIQHYEGLRGKRCWFFQSAVHKLRNHQTRNGGAIFCANCGADYTSEYWREDHAAMWENTRNWPDPRICRACWRPQGDQRPVGPV